MKKKVLGVETKTELHTHMMGMLTAGGFINFLSQFGYCFPINKMGEIDFDRSSVERVPAREALYDNNILSQLSIPHGKKSDYSRLNEFYTTRNRLMAYLIYYLSKIQNKIQNPELKYIIYGLYLEDCLRELIDQEVEYVEISFSNAPIIENCIKYVNPSVLGNIKCKFLLSTDRHGIAKDFRQSSRHMVGLIEKNIAVGFDIMGAEIPFTDLDMDRSSKFGLEQKMTPIIEKLNAWGNSTLRIHSGETRLSGENTEKTLTIIERIANTLNIVIPPPEIRIGHGVYFRESEEYLRLLKKFGCIVEVNASSNYALDNVDKYSDIPYNYYLDNDIPVVICSDGHGLYDTDKETEDIIALANTSEDNFKKIIEIDRKIRKIK